MAKIIEDIKEALKKQNLSQTKIAEAICADQKTVNNLLSGRTRKLDLVLIGKLQAALGIVSEPETPYSGVPERSVKDSRRQLAYELLNEESDEELEELIFKLLQKKKARGGDSSQG